MREDIRKIQERMEAAEYVTDAPVATSVHLAMRLRKPLLIEGPAGVGKTEVAKVMARMLGTNLIRLQCYEGLDASTALYEWNYQKQLLHIKLDEADHNTRAMADKEHEIFSESFLLRRPLLQAITQNSHAPVLLVDEVDRCDEEFEAFMLEVFSDWQVTIPEIGTIKATHPPHVILTSNRTRELSDALRRRCLYLWIDYPTFDKEIPIVERRTPARLPLSLDRLPDLRQGDRDRGAQGAGRQQAAGRRDRAFHGIAATRAAEQGPRRGRDARLGQRAGRAAWRPSRRDARSA